MEIRKYVWNTDGTGSTAACPYCGVEIGRMSSYSEEAYDSVFGRCPHIVREIDGTKENISEVLELVESDKYEVDADICLAQRVGATTTDLYFVKEGR